MPKNSKSGGFIYGAFVLSLSGIVVRIIGVFFKIPLTNMVGAANMSHFTCAYEVYNFMLSVATSGLPVGICTVVSSFSAVGRRRDIKTLMRAVTLIFVCVGAILTVLGLVFSQPLAQAINSYETVFAIRAIVPAIFFMSVVSVFRGYFQGFNNMTPTAVSNVIEAVVKLGAGYSIAYYLKYIMKKPDSVVVAGGILGITLGTVLSAAFLVLRYAFRKREAVSVRKLSSDIQTPVGAILKRFFAVTLPIIVSSITVHLMGFVDVCCVMRTLRGYMPVEKAQLLWGSYSSMSLTVFNLPSFLIISIGISLVPSISAAFARKNSPRLRYNFDMALKFSSVIAFGCAFGLAGVSEQVIHLLYGNAEGTTQAAQLLRVLSFSLVSVGLTNITSHILQATEKSYLSVLSTAVGTLLKTALTVFLLSIPRLNIFGAPLATCISYPVMLAMNFIFIRSSLGIVPLPKDVFFKPFVAGIGCLASIKIFLFVFDDLLSPEILLITVILIAVIVYFILIFIQKLVTINEITQVFKKNEKNS